MTVKKAALLSVFADQTRANQAIHMLKDAGFTDEHQIGVAHHEPAEGFFASLKSLLTGQDTTPQSLERNLRDQGYSSEEAQYYAHAYETRHTLVWVDAHGQEQEVWTILAQNGATAYQSASQEPSSAQINTSQAKTFASTVDNRAPDGVPGDEKRTIEVREEQLQVEKEKIQTGDVQVHKEIVTEQQHITVPVTHEEVVVTQTHLAHEETSDTPVPHDEEVIRLPVSEERVHVTKIPVETGEVSIQKRVVQENEQVNETVRREKVRIEQQGDAPIHGTKSDRFHPDQVKEDNP
jgi:uncharacterized protein (TIGR02271 family)